MSTKPTTAADSSEAPARPGMLDVIGPDGLPTIDPAAAAGRAVEFVQRKGYGVHTTAIIAYIAERAVDTADLNVVILEQLSEKLLNAGSVDEILMPFEPSGSERYLNQPIQINGAGFLESDYTEGFPYYASLQITVVATGEDAVITIGGEKVMYQVAAFDMKEAWPIVCRISKRTKPTKSGFYPLELLPAV